jgi:hypothetical protein
MRPLRTWFVLDKLGNSIYIAISHAYIEIKFSRGQVMPGPIGGAIVSFMSLIFCWYLSVIALLSAAADVGDA